MTEENGLLERYKAIARGFDHEATVVGQRVTWAVLFSSGLMAATALLVNAVLGLNAADKPPADGQSALIMLLAFIIAVLGLGFSIVTLRGVRASQHQSDYLRKKYGTLVKAGGLKLMQLVRPFGDPQDHLRGNEVARTFPIVMIAVWGGAALVELLVLLFFFGMWFPPDGFGVRRIAPLAIEGSRAPTPQINARKPPSDRTVSVRPNP